MKDYDMNYAKDNFNPPTCKKCGRKANVMVKYGYYDEADVSIECLVCKIVYDWQSEPFQGEK